MFPEKFTGRLAAFLFAGGAPVGPPSNDLMNTKERIDVALNIVLHKNQRIIHSNPARFKYIKTGKRFGKTYWAIFELLQKAFMT